MDDNDKKAADSKDDRIAIPDPFAKALMVSYLGRREADLGSLRLALAGDDFDAIKIKGHNLYGSGSAYGLDRITELGGALEAAARKKNHAEIGRLIESLETFVRKLRVV